MRFRQNLRISLSLAYTKYRNLGNEVSPERNVRTQPVEAQYRNLGNEVSPEQRHQARVEVREYRNLGNEVSPEQRLDFRFSSF